MVKVNKNSANKDTEMTEEIGKLLTKGTSEYGLFMKYLKYNATKGNRKLLAVDHWALCDKEQLDMIKGSKPKLLKPKYFQDEKSFLDLAKQHKRYSDVGGVRHYHRFVDFWQSDLAKDIEVSFIQ